MISIIIPVHNSINYIEQTIDSILNQTFQEFELILVDDGSFDGTEKVLKDYQNKSKKIKVIKQRNMGLSNARMAGYKVSMGDYIVFFDHDDIVSPIILEKMIIEIQNAELVCAGAENINSSQIEGVKFNENDYICIQYNGNQLMRMLYNSDRPTKLLGALWGILIPRAFLENMMDEILMDKDILPITYFEDIHLVYRLFNNARRVIFLDGTFVLHRISNSCLSRSLTPNHYLYETMSAGKIQLHYLKNIHEDICYYNYLSSYLKTVMRMWWIEKENNINIGINLKEEFYPYAIDFFVYNNTSFVEKCIIRLFYYSPIVWKLVFGNIWFKVKYN